MPARRQIGVYALLVALSVGAFAASIFVGRGDLTDEQLFETLLELRSTRSAVAYLAGAALAVGGVLVQGLFRNPLASPSLLGTTAGASLGGQVALLLSSTLISASVSDWLVPEMFVPLGCIVGAFGSLLLLLSVARFQDDVVVLLLTGFLLSSVFLSLGSLVTTLAQQTWELGRAVVAFSLGGVSGAGFRHVLVALPLVIAGVVAAMAWARPLDLLLSGEDEATSLGLDVRQVRWWCVTWTALLTAGAVAVGGGVGFVGLIVPHVMRRFVGSLHAPLVPATALGGGAFLVACDVIARAIPSQSEVPLGVVTGLIGAPLFLSLLLRNRRETARA
jgi:iron complex transport system permease protein